MSGVTPLALAKVLTLVASLAVVLSGCSYDYLSHDERVSYRAGNAVKANLERETIDPSAKTYKKTSGLGSNGNVMPADPAATP